MAAMKGDQKISSDKLAEMLDNLRDLPLNQQIDFVDCVLGYVEGAALPIAKDVKLELKEVLHMQNILKQEQKDLSIFGKILEICDAL